MLETVEGMGLCWDSLEDAIEGVLWFLIDFPPAQRPQLLQTCS